MIRINDAVTSKVSGSEKTESINKIEASMCLSKVQICGEGTLRIEYSKDEGNNLHVIEFELNSIDVAATKIVMPATKRGTKIEISPNKLDGCVFKDLRNNISIDCKSASINTKTMLGVALRDKLNVELKQVLAKTLMNKLEQLGELKREGDEKLFRNENSYNGIEAPNHIMYKLENLKSKDGKIEYEFLIELDKKDPCMGLYYGCKALIKTENSEAKIDQLKREWEDNIRDHVCRRLNNTFPDKNFTYRMKPTDNANDNTYWTFWISLNEDENIKEVGVRALIIIRDEYKRYIDGENYTKDATSKFFFKAGDIKIDNKSEAHSQTAYTEEAYQEFLKAYPFKGQKDKILTKEWEDFMKENIFTKQADLERYDRYEFAWHVKSEQMTEFVSLLSTKRDEFVKKVKGEEFIKEKRLPKDVYNKREYNGSYPWENLCRLLLVKDTSGSCGDLQVKPISLDTLKKTYSRIKEKESKKEKDANVQALAARRK